MIFLLYFREAFNFEMRFCNECAVPVHTGVTIKLWLLYFKPPRLLEWFSMS